MGKAGRRKKQRAKERRQAARHNMTVEKYRRLNPRKGRR